jgi:hypothetical protein
MSYPSHESYPGLCSLYLSLCTKCTEEVIIRAVGALWLLIEVCYIVCEAMLIESAFAVAWCPAVAN